MKISAQIPGVSEKANKWLAYYAIAGVGSWVFLQVFYVQAGKQYWLGFGNPTPTDVGSQVLGQLEQIVLWPVALFCTVTGNGVTPL